MRYVFVYRIPQIGAIFGPLAFIQQIQTPEFVCIMWAESQKNVCNIRNQQVKNEFVFFCTDMWKREKQKRGKSSWMSKLFSFFFYKFSQRSVHYENMQRKENFRRISIHNNLIKMLIMTKLLKNVLRNILFAKHCHFHKVLVKQWKIIHFTYINLYAWPKKYMNIQSAISEDWRAFVLCDKKVNYNRAGVIMEAVLWCQLQAFTADQSN